MGKANQLFEGDPIYKADIAKRCGALVDMSEKKIRELMKQAIYALKRLKDAQKEIKEKYQTRNCAWCGDTIKPGSPFIAYDRDEIYCDWECMARDNGGFEVEFSLSDVDDERKYYLSYFWPKPEEDEQKGKEDNNEVQD